MPRLRVRIELNRGGVGVPLQKLASVTQESQKFLQMLAQDVQIERDRGEWLAFDFDHESLNFTAEYIGPVSTEQVQAFFAAFDGVTSLRRATITQFTRIADAIDEDELIGFGLYASGHETEPTEWRCLSRLDALRIAEEIQLLLGASGELEQETHLPAVIDHSRGARLFKDRHDRQASMAEDSRLPELVRDVETNLSKRITHLENEVETHTHQISGLRENSTAVEESMRSLLTSVESFCGQATRHIEGITTPKLLAPAGPTDSGGRRRAIIAASIAVIAIVGLSGFLWWPKTAQSNTTPPVETNVQAAKPTPVGSVTPAPEPATAKPAPKQSSKPTPLLSREITETAGEPMHIEFEAREPAWVSVTDADGKHLFVGILQANETRSFDLSKNGVLRTGNAGGLIVRFNGKDIGQLGPAGKVRDVEFRKNSFKIRQPAAG